MAALLELQLKLSACLPSFLHVPVDKYVTAGDSAEQKTTEAVITQFGKLLAKHKDADGDFARCTSVSHAVQDWRR